MPATLLRGLRPDLVHGAPDGQAAVGQHQARRRQPAIPEIAQHLSPRLGRLAVAGSHRQDLLAAVAQGADGSVPQNLTGGKSETFRPPTPCRRGLDEATTQDALGSVQGQGGSGGPERAADGQRAGPKFSVHPSQIHGWKKQLLIAPIAGRLGRPRSRGRRGSTRDRGGVHTAIYVWWIRGLWPAEPTTTPSRRRLASST